LGLKGGKIHDLHTSANINTEHCHVIGLCSKTSGYVSAIITLQQLFNYQNKFHKIYLKFGIELK